MQQKWYTKASVQSAIVVGVFGLIGLVFQTFFQVPGLKDKIYRLEEVNKNKDNTIQQLETQLVPFKTIALERYTGNENERLKKLTDEIGTLGAKLEEERWRRAAKFPYNGATHLGACIGGEYLCQVLEGTIKDDNNIISPVCNEHSYEVWQKTISYEPDFPFSYYYLAFCYRENHNPEWFNFANKAKVILDKTVKFDEPNTGHAQLLQLINQMIANSN